MHQFLLYICISSMSIIPKEKSTFYVGLKMRTELFAAHCMSGHHLPLYYVTLHILTCHLALLPISIKQNYALECFMLPPS